ncbi:MAG: uncharacterized protein HW419_188 [Deltaproteobacteria bacterium]|nr:uncharacterized protein [Deltaproteobacteria bacterium]
MPKMLIPTLVFTLLSACASQRPALYPNEQLRRVGSATANRDIDDCMRQAEHYVSSSGRVGKTAEGIVSESGTSAAIGAAAGAAGGAIIGRAGTGAAVGAAGAGAAGVTRGLIHGVTNKSEPSPTFKNFVNHCLRDKGYDPIGWN